MPADILRSCDCLEGFVGRLGGRRGWRQRDRGRVSQGPLTAFKSSERAGLTPATHRREIADRAKGREGDGEEVSRSAQQFLECI